MVKKWTWDEFESCEDNELLARIIGDPTSDDSAETYLARVSFHANDEYISHLEKQVEILKKGLEFYGDKKSWHLEERGFDRQFTSMWVNDREKVDETRAFAGKTARKALKDAGLLEVGSE